MITHFFFIFHESRNCFRDSLDMNCSVDGHTITQITQDLWNIMQELLAKQEEQIKIIVEETFEPLLAGFDTAQMRLPLLKNTFSLWRTLAFKRLTALPFYSQNKQQMNKLFAILVDTHYLNLFISKVKTTENILQDVGNEINIGLSSDSPLLNELMPEYTRALWQHTLFCQLFEDLVSLPYLQDIFPQNKKYKLAPRYSQLSAVRAERGGQMMEKVGEGVLKKGVGELAEKIFTKTFLLRASSIAIRLNPVAIAATFAFSTLMETYRQSKREEEVASKMKALLQACKENVEVMQKLQQQCVALLPGAAGGDEGARKQLLIRVRQVMQVDWLQVQRYQDQDEWQVIVLGGDPEQEVK